MTLPDVTPLDVTPLDVTLLEVAPAGLRRCSADLLGLADELRGAVAGDNAVALGDCAAAVAAGGLGVVADAALTDLVARIRAAGEGLRAAADGYEAADERSAIRLSRRSRW